MNSSSAPRLSMSDRGLTFVPMDLERRIGHDEIGMLGLAGVDEAPYTAL
jgi:hypothetical protein